MPSDSLFLELAKARSQPSGAYRAAAAGIGAVDEGLSGYLKGQEIADSIRQRKLKQQTLGEALGGQPIEQGLMDLTGEEGAIQHPTLAIAAALAKAKHEDRRRILQFVGTQGKNALLFDSNAGGISTTPLPESDQPILPRTMTPTLSPYASPTGQPLAFTPGPNGGFAPVSSSPGVGGTPVLKQGNEQAISDAALMQTQAPNIDKLFDAYDALDASGKMGGVRAKLQATPAGYLLDPGMKQVENSLKLAAFTFGGKNLTANERRVVYGAFFPGGLSNQESRNQNRAILKDYFSGKIDLLQAANLLGPAGAPLRGMLQSKLSGATGGTPDPSLHAVATNDQGVTIETNDGGKTWRPVNGGN